MFLIPGRIGEVHHRVAHLCVTKREMGEKWFIIVRGRLIQHFPADQMRLILELILDDQSMHKIKLYSSWNTDDRQVVHWHWHFTHTAGKTG